MTTFRRRIEAAVEAREPLDTPELAALAAEFNDQAFWRSQVRLDHAIDSWREQNGPAATTGKSPRRHGRLGWPLAAAAVSAAALVWLTQAPPQAEPETPSATTAVSTIAVEAPKPAALPSDGAFVGEPERLVIASTDRSQDAFAEATVTAERLAYAFEPVGEQVGTVVRFLIDAVPGADVFAM